MEARLGGEPIAGRGQETGDNRSEISAGGKRTPEAGSPPKIETESAVEATSIAVESSESLDEEAESAFRAEARARGEMPVAVTKAEAEPEESGPLPKLDDLVKRIPAEVRETLEDLFRAKFVTVKRVPAKALK